MPPANYRTMSRTSMVFLVLTIPYTVVMLSIISTYFDSNYYNQSVSFANLMALFIIWAGLAIGSLLSLIHDFCKKA